MWADGRDAKFSREASRRLEMENVLVTDLLKGSENIDRMRSEIQTTISMVLGLVKPFLKKGKSNAFCQMFGDSRDSCEWELCWGGDPKRDPELQCRVKGEIVYSTFHIGFTLRLEDIQTVHEGLHFFVDGLVSEFPGLLGKLNVLLTASKKKF
jgi:hypothetical protein